MPPRFEKNAEHSPAKPLLTQVLDELGQEIISGTVDVGDTFKLMDISERFQISRTVAREAMRALEQLGLVSSSRRIGLTVLPRDQWAVFDSAIIRWRLADDAQRADQLRSLRELSLAVEPIAARNVALSASEAEIQLLEESAAENDISFHELLLKFSKNDMFSGLVSSISVVHKRKESNAEKQTLIDAIRNRDAATAEHSARELLLAEFS